MKIESLFNNETRANVGQRPYIIAEIGANHNGDIDLAKKTILKAKECGADCVKFQSWTPSSLISEAEYEANQKYTDSPKKHFGSLREMVDRYYLRDAQHVELNTFCIQNEIQFNSTPFSINELELLVKLDVPFIKVASMDVDNIKLLDAIASTGKTVVLSTGMASLNEIATAVELIEKRNNSKIILLHCVSLYPPKNSILNMRNIEMLKSSFGYPVGFSDHTMGISMPIVSMALGACLIEKHFTLDKSLPGWDHEMSANPDELKQLCVAADEVPVALGLTKREVSKEEAEKRLRFRRSLVLTRDMRKGDIITDEHLDAKRPGTGIPPTESKYLLGRSVNKDMRADTLIHWEDIS